MPIQLKPIREAHNLTQKELGDKVGASHKTISNIERGRRKPSYDLLVALARELNCTVDDLIKETA
ncbi:MAG: helix-turn-helix domain-containing protein [Clostridiales bacterium]|nr:helix-turn-helix domain-containing protein [Clostridiales bacterium]